MSYVIASIVFMLMLCGRAEATVIDYGSSPEGPLAHTITYDGVQVSGWRIVDGVWIPQDLYRRTDAPDDLGLGVCNTQSGSCGDSQRNEIDSNSPGRDVVAFSTAGVRLLYANLSSVDGSPTRQDAWALYLTDMYLPDLAQLTPFATGSGVGVVNPVVSLEGQAFDWLYVTTNGLNSDFLIQGLETVDSTTPEPGTMALLALPFALLGMRYRGRRS